MTINQGPRFVLAVIAIALGALTARGDDPPRWPYLPPAEQGAALYQSRLINNGAKIEVVDVANGRTIIGGSPQVTVWDDYALNNAVRPTVEMRQQPTGFDLVYTFTNETAAPQPMGRLRMGSMLLGEQINWHDFSYSGEERVASAESYVAITRNYPQSWYSPVAVFRNADYAIGISLLYPMMEYKHDVRVALINNSVPGRGLEGWEAIFQLQNVGGEGTYDGIRYPNDLAPGETRSYVLAVRISRDQTDWLRTLLPYRDFFLKFYGGVRYARNTEPLIGVANGGLWLSSDSNPYGFGSWRPDLNGWGSYTTGLKALEGWKNIMVWEPTGRYRNNIGGNMPFNFTSQWLADPELATALDPEVGFPSVAAAGKNLGFWWGHAASVYFGWDSFHAEALDPDNPEHVRRANAELDLAVQAGATMIGLDTFHPAFTAPWNLTRWIQAMQARHPHVRFVAEPLSFDILHSLAPGFMTGFISGPADPRTVDDLFPIKIPHMLANFILPGNEIWASFNYGPHGHYLQITPTAQMINDDIVRYARLGYTPIMFPNIDNVTLQNRPDQKAVEAWNQVVPADLLASYKWNRNYSNSAIIRRPDGSMAIIEASSPTEAPAPPPAPEGEGGEGGGGMVMGSAPDPTRHAARGARGASKLNLAEAVPDRFSSMASPDFSPAGAGKGRVDTKVRSTAVKQNTKVDTSAPKEHHTMQPASDGTSGASAPVGNVRGAGSIRVVPSSVPGMRQGASAATAPLGRASGRVESGMTLSAVRQAILRAQRARPVVGAGVVEVER